MATTKNTWKAIITKEEIADLRDGQLLSWAKVAEALELGSPGSARRVYSALVRPHTESILPGRSTKGSTATPVHLEGADLETVRATLVGKTMTVQRKNGTEEIPVTKVTSLKGETVNFNDGNKARSVKAPAIIAVQ